MGGSYSGGSCNGSGLIYVPEMNDGNLIFKLSDTPGDDLIDVGSLGAEIYVGDDEPEDKRKVWLDTSEQAVGSMNSLDVVYNAYVIAGGGLSKEAFIRAFKNIK